MKSELRIVTRTLRVMGKALFELVKALLKIVYLIERAKNNLIAKLFNKLPRLAKVAIIYTLVILSVMNFVTLPQVKIDNVKALTTNVNQVVETIEEKVVEEETTETTEEKVEETETSVVEETTEKKTNNCKLGNEIACQIYDKAIEKGLTQDQAIIVVAISAHETGYWKSSLFVKYQNFGGVTSSKGGFAHYNSREEGLESFVNLLVNGYFNKGLNTIEKIGAKYCPVGAKNDKDNLNSNWVPSVTSISKKYSKMM